MIYQIDTAESIRRILVTPLGSRVMMPDYGSRLFELIDKTVNDEWVLDATRHTYEAIEKNEPRAIIKRVRIQTGDTVSIRIEYAENGIDRAIGLGFTDVENATV
ncbi:GPW/gp25 family protein [Hydrogenimonas sp.]